MDGDELTIGRSFVERQPSVARALIARGLLSRALVPDFVTGVVCERWSLRTDSEGAAEAASADGSVYELAVAGGCPSGNVWLSEIEQRASADVSTGEMPLPPQPSLVSPDALVGVLDDEERARSLDELEAPRLFMIIIDNYQFGTG